MRPQAASRSSTPRIPRVTATLPSAGGLDFQAFLDGFSAAPSTDARTVAAPGSSPRSIEVRAGLPRPSKGGWIGRQLRALLEPTAWSSGAPTLHFAAISPLELRLLPRSRAQAVPCWGPITRSDPSPTTAGAFGAERGRGFGAGVARTGLDRQGVEARGGGLAGCWRFGSTTA